MGTLSSLVVIINFLCRPYLVCTRLFCPSIRCPVGPHPWVQLYVHYIVCILIRVLQVTCLLDKSIRSLLSKGSSRCGFGSESPTHLQGVHFSPLDSFLLQCSCPSFSVDVHPLIDTPALTVMY